MRQQLQSPDSGAENCRVLCLFLAMRYGAGHQVLAVHLLSAPRTHRAALLFLALSRGQGSSHVGVHGPPTNNKLIANNRATMRDRHIVFL